MRWIAAGFIIAHGLVTAGVGISATIPLAGIQALQEA
jgi:hypothetical protein